MHTSDLMTKRPIEAAHTGVAYRRRVATRYGTPLPEMAFAAGMATVLTGLVAVDRVGQILAVLWIVH